MGDSKKIISIVLTLIFLFSTGCGIIKYNPPEKAIGGEKDEHGCLGPAGYSWCEEKQKCLRIWEEYCPGIDDYYDTEENSQKAVDISTEYLTQKPLYKDYNGRILNTEDIIFMRCIGCFSVYYNYIIDNENDEVESVNVRVDIDSWTPKLAEFTKGDIIIIPSDDCDAVGGEIRADCGENETRTAMVSGYSSKRSCCVILED